jgi:hypothetical protein
LQCCWARPAKAGVLFPRCPWFTASAGATVV